MFRFLPAAALALTSLVAPVTALATDQSETCQVTSGVVATIVTLRADGASAPAIKQSLTNGQNAVPSKFSGTVAPLVDWVFTLDQAVVEGPAAAQTISDAYRQTCVGFKP
ncbi:hypothetical protein [Roseovarius aestuariivivens]|uniref:hypothetical protein n=1 Tax=Roseovarius aestuariivivens TaxID=1888910 RepID=UPI00108180D1|nr:hypothetical protein [Roseovarius aestuariivivens]